jgi:hypothetical protein
VRNTVTLTHLTKLKTSEGRELKQLFAQNAKMAHAMRYGVNAWLPAKHEFLATQFEHTRDLEASPRRSMSGLVRRTPPRPASFDAARVAFEDAWRKYLPRRSEADFQAWRDQETWTERKYAMRERGERLPSQTPSSLMRCPCGETFDSHRLKHTVIHLPHITAAQGTRH